MNRELTDAEVDHVLDRFDQTDPAMRRRIVAQLMMDNARFMARIADLLETRVALLTEFDQVLIQLKDAWARQTEGPDLWPIFEALCTAVAKAKGVTP